ncbi:unnamed protein product [Sphagnum balticum]
MHKTNGLHHKTKAANIIPLYLKNCTITVVLIILGLTLFVNLGFTVFYQYLNQLYILDEVYDIESLRELNMIEKLTIVVSPPVGEGLKAFVEHYSICKPVYAIVIIWPSSKSSPDPNEYFKFSKTHSKVIYITYDDTIQSSKYVFPFTLPETVIDTNGHQFSDFMKLLHEHPICVPLAFSLYPYITSVGRNNGIDSVGPPVYIDVPIRINKDIRIDSPKSKFSSVELITRSSQCLNDVITLLNIDKEKISYARHKSSQAVNHVWW